MKNFIQPGNFLTVVLAAAIESGEGLLVNDTFGVAAKSGGIGDEVELALEGVFELPKAAVGVSQGAKTYWDDAAKVVTNVAMGNKLIGICWATVISGDAKMKVRLMDAPHV